MPIWLRRFTFETLREYYEKQQESIEKQQNLVKNNPKEISKPNIIPPTYVAKTPKAPNQ